MTASSWKSSSSKGWWSASILENQRRSSETFLALSSSVWRQVEEKHGRRRRKQENIPVLSWFFKNNRVSPTSSRSFKTQSYWSYSTGQCCYSEQLLPVHLSHRMCNQFTLHHEFRIDLGGQNMSKRQTAFFTFVDLMNEEHKDPDTIDLEAQRLAWYNKKKTWKKHLNKVYSQYMHKAWKRHQNAAYWVDIKLALKRKDSSSIKHDRTQSFFTTHFQLIVSRRILWWKLEKSCTRK